MPLASISDSQRRCVPAANWTATVYPGLPAEIWPLNPAAPRGAGSYLAFHGGVSPESGLDHGLGSFVPLLRDPRMEFIGEVDEAGKPAFLGNAVALLSPIDWAEPFGLATIEAMSCGTPVIAWRRATISRSTARSDAGAP